MTEFFVFLYAMLAVFVISALQRNRRSERQPHQMVVAMGWGLFSLSSTLAVLMVGLAVVLAMGFQVPFAAPAF